MRRQLILLCCGEDLQGAEPN
uniref:Uncharacterized protein n=1 Tax=Anguilla anguilla TaxID=7936 RepID=A0A0E9QID2_ANGAN